MVEQHSTDQPATPGGPPDETTAKKEALIKALILKIQQTAKDVHDTGTGTLKLNQQELQDLLQTFVFSDPDALKTAEKAGLVVPTLPTILDFIIHGGTPNVEFLKENGINKVEFTAQDTKFSLGLFGAPPKDFTIDQFTIGITNFHKISDGLRMDGQVGLVDLTIDPDPPVDEIPGIGLLSFVAPSNVGILMRDVLRGNQIMTVLYNKTVPIIAANGPEHATTQVKGMKVDIGDDKFTMTFLRDTFTPTNTTTLLPQMKNGHSHTKP